MARGVRDDLCDLRRSQVVVLFLTLQHLYACVANTSRCSQHNPPPPQVFGALRVRRCFRFFVHCFGCLLFPGHNPTATKDLTWRMYTSVFLLDLACCPPPPKPSLDSLTTVPPSAPLLSVSGHRKLKTSTLCCETPKLKSLRVMTPKNNRFMKPPIYVYYELDNYYQNHRRYVKSRSSLQLLGEVCRCYSGRVCRRANSALSVGAAVKMPPHAHIFVALSEAWSMSVCDSKTLLRHYWTKFWNQNNT